MQDIITETVEFARCSGHAIKMQRMAAGLSQKALAERIMRKTGCGQIMINGSSVECSRGTIERIENRFPVQFYTTRNSAEIIQEILTQD